VKKILLVISIISTLSLASYAEGMKSSFWAGYGSLSMSDMNQGLNTKISNGLILGFDADYSISDNISVGPRIEYIAGNQGKYSMNAVSTFTDYSFTDFFGNIDPITYTTKISIKRTVDVSLLPIMIGGKYHQVMSDAIDLVGAAYVGYGMAQGNDKYSTLITEDDEFLSLFIYESESKSFHGNGFVSDLSIGGEYYIDDMWSIGLNLGYSMANIAKIKTSDGKVMKKENGSNMSLDFSGMRVTGALNCRF
jgi:hypothetical protein